jgi:hypothetical protein
MALSDEALERELATDLRTLGADLLGDDAFYTELYKSLAGVPWAQEGGHIALSWKRLEKLLNALRAENDLPALKLARSGGEGEISSRVMAALAPLGWTLAH